MLRQVAGFLRRGIFTARRRVNRPLQRLQQFWPLQILGWSVYAGGIFIGLVHRRYPDAVAYDFVFFSDSTFEIENHASLPRGQFRDSLFRTADQDYFRMMGIPQIRGRFFKPSERV